MERGLTALQEMALRRQVAAIVKPDPRHEIEMLRATIQGPSKAVMDYVAGGTRQQKWKRLNPGKVREAQKLLMRKRRAR